MSPAARLLVTVARHPELDAALARRLPGVSATYRDPTDVGPWSELEAVLLGGARDPIPTFDGHNAPKLRFAQRLYTGLDGFPWSSFPEEVRVAGNVGAYAPYVAEQAMALLLALAKRLLPNYEALRSGRLRPVAPTQTLLGRRALVLGFGAIGQELGSRLASFGAIVHGVNRTGEGRAPAEKMYSARHLVDALGAADVIIDCRPLTRETRGSLNGEMFDRFRAEALYVNVGRAGTVDEAALTRFLREHPSAGAAFDPWWEEDFARGEVRPDHPLFSLPNFLGSPHNAAIARGARERAYDFAAANLARYFRGETPLGLGRREEYLES